jgi:hypothetical protein
VTGNRGADLLVHGVIRRPAAPGGVQADELPALGQAVLLQPVGGDQPGSIVVRRSRDGLQQPLFLHHLPSPEAWVMSVQTV